MVPFAGNVAQMFLDFIKNGTIPNADALIMVSDDMIVSESLFDRPLIISQVDIDTANILAPYSFSNNQSLISVMNHTFINNCYILNPVTPTHLILCGLWALVGIIWYVLTYWILKAHSFFL